MLLEHGHIHLFTYCLWSVAQWSGCNRDQMASKVKNSIWPFTESLPTSDLKSPGKRIMAMELPFGYAKEHW